MRTKLFFNKINDQSLCFSIIEKSEDKRTVTLITPHLLLTYGFVSVDLVKTITGINVKESGTDRILTRLDRMSLDSAEDIWPSLLLLSSESYKQGDEDCKDSYAKDVATMY